MKYDFSEHLKGILAKLSKRDPVAHKIIASARQCWGWQYSWGIVAGAMKSPRWNTAPWMRSVKGVLVSWCKFDSFFLFLKADGKLLKNVLSPEDIESRPQPLGKAYQSQEFFSG